MKHRHWTIMAHNGTENNAYQDYISIEILDALTEQDAVRQAKRVISSKKEYVVKGVRECGMCEFAKEAGKFFKKETGESE